MRVLNSDKFDHLAEDMKHSRKYSSHNLVQIKEDEKITETIEEEVINENENEIETANENGNGNGNEVENANIDNVDVEKENANDNSNSNNDSNGNESKEANSECEILEKANQ